MDGVAPESFEAGGWWTTTMLWAIVLFGSFLLNATLLFAFLKRPGLRTISNRFVMNLVASNLLTCMLLTILLMLDGPPPSYLGSSLCSISEGASALVTASSILSVLLIAIDQYFAVVDPLRYRTRIDKLKCGMLILSIWVMSAVIALVAGFNPSPQSLWLMCLPRDSQRNFPLNTSINLTLNSTILFGNGTEGYDVEGELKVTEINGSSTIEEDLRFAENSTMFSSKTILESSEKVPQFRVTYGLAYAGFYAIFVYLLPFIGVCWMYVSIYLAAHKNSERARRTGSGPMLSSPSFCEEWGERSTIARQEYSTDDFRRIPKISSLSSIDESIETSPSHIPRQRSEMMISSSPIEEEPASSGVVFTVGSQKVDVTPSNKSARLDPSSAKDMSKLVPISSSLKSQFLDKRFEDPLDDNLVRSKFNDFHLSDQRRRSSHDIETDRSMLEKFRRDNESSDDSADEEIMFAFSKNRRLEDIEVAKCQNSIDASEDLLSPSKDPDKPKVADKVQSSYKVIGGSGNSILSRAALENHNEESAQQTRDEIFQKMTSAHNFGDSAPMVTITPPHKAQPLHRVSSVKSTSSYINSLKYRISNASLFRYREETRAARISALVIVMGLICWTPYTVVMMLRNMPQEVMSNDDLPHSYDVAAIGLLILAAYVTPLLFGYRSRRMKRELRKIFCFKKELSYKNNRSLMAKKVLKRKHSSNLGQIEMDSKYNILSCVYGRSKWPKEKVQFMQVPETALAVETCRSSFSSGASTQISTTSTEE